MNLKMKYLKLIIGLLLLPIVLLAKEKPKKGIVSFDTDYTISLVRNAQINGGNYIVANSYEGTILVFTEDGKKVWENKLSGFANHDVWCEDITGDGTDEILTANADGNLYVLDAKGKLMWQNQPSETPLTAVTVMNGKNGKYIVTGGMDKNLYYLSSTGNVFKTIASVDYSIDKSWGKNTEKASPKLKEHTANFLRKATYKNNEEILVLHGTINQNSSTGSIYLFKADAALPFKKIKVGDKGTVGDLRIADTNKDGVDELYLGSSGMIQAAQLTVIDLNATEKIKPIYAKFQKSFRKQLDHFGYRVAQTEWVSDGKTEKLFTLFGTRIILQPTSLEVEKAEVLATNYSYNDLWKDTSNGNILLASAQSGGSCIHIINTKVPSWKKEYIALQPEGKLAKVIQNTADFRTSIKSFKKGKWEGKSQDVYFMTESIKEGNQAVIERISKTNTSPYFLKSQHMAKVENWDRSSFGNEVYEKKRDRRKKYVNSQEQMLNTLLPLYKNNPGIAYWGGHGNDPLMISLDTEKKVIDAGGKEKKLVMIFPELEHYDENFEYYLNNYLYPLAEYSEGKNANIYIRSKHTFWQAIIYKPMWNGLLSGKYAEVFVPSMEETTDKSMDLSVAGKMGIWASGATESWGARGARDNASYYRLRQHSHQMVPNHFLRMLVYNIASGAQYINNFPVDQEYISVLYEMVANGVIYVPKKSEIVSFNPVHLSMTAPNPVYLNEGNNAKWTTFYSKEHEEKNKMVFSRLNGSWPASPVRAHDFSAYASGSKERRLDFLPKYSKGLVLITPPQEGVYADKDAPRGKLEDHLHPMYKGNMQEFITDGKDYLSADGKEHYPADKYYTNVAKAIEEGAKKLPINVSGDVAWVAVQTDKKHLRLTLIDNGYINPNDRVAEITFNGIKVAKITDVVNKKEYKIKGNTTSIDVPCGLFRFIDVELSEEMKQTM
ncbi:hypothetical protein EI427_17275 [Flammeovirga pectinis]|uniref:Bulb-type lectin domain-containing protein n=2 Tax=Flammeovirga pectinis TaxID=2494373 RepID=A0A3Q9FQU3_9BACT|nr:hypothetical protein EI427_17275 [Flammeovirga pectinis]